MTNQNQAPAARKAAAPSTSPAPTTPPATTEEPKPEQKPTIGRIVHYFNTDGEVRPAIITEVDGASVSLTIFNSLGSHFKDDVPHAPFPTPHCWSWPERNN